MFGHQTLDLDGTRIRNSIQPNMLDPDPGSLNADPKHWLIFPLCLCSLFPGSSWAGCSPSAASSYSSSLSSTPSGPHRSTTCKLQSSFLDPHHFDTDPDSTYHPNADPNADPDSDFYLFVTVTISATTQIFFIFHTYSINIQGVIISQCCHQCFGSGSKSGSASALILLSWIGIVPSSKEIDLNK
jgi:hypothetical protein